MAQHLILKLVQIQMKRQVFADPGYKRRVPDALIVLQQHPTKQLHGPVGVKPLQQLLVAQPGVVLEKHQAE